MYSSHEQRSVLQVTPSGAVTVTPSTVAAIAAFPAATLKGNSAVVPSTAAAVAAVPTPTVLLGGNANIAPSTVVATAALPAPTVVGTAPNATVTATTVATVAAVPAPTVSVETIRELNTSTDADVTANVNITTKAQKLIWWHDSAWWAILYDHTYGYWAIFERVSTPSVGWRRASASISSTAAARLDACFDKTSRVYIAEINATQNKAYKVLYDSTPRSWTVETSANTPGAWAGSGSQSMNQSCALDTASRLWVGRVTSGNLLKYYALNTSDLSSAVSDTTHTTLISTKNLVDVVAFNDGTASIGMFFSNVNDPTIADVMSFAHRHDSDAGTTWQTTETVVSATDMADDHPSIMADSASGVLYVAYKTTKSKGSGQPNIVASKRSTSAVWDSPHTVWNHGEAPDSDEFTRCRIFIDATNDEVYVIASWSVPGSSGGHKYKKATMASLTFGGTGTDTTIRSTAGQASNDVNAPKYEVDTTSDILVVSENEDGDILVDWVLLPENITATPSTVAAVASVPAPTVAATAKVSPSAIVAVAVVPVSTVQGAAVVTPATVAAVVGLQTPAVVVAGNVTANPATLSAVAAVPAPVIQAAARPTPGSVVATAGVGAPTVIAALVVAPATVAAVAGVPPPTLRGAATTTPTTAGAVVAVGVPAVTGDALVAPSTVASVVSVPTPAVAVGGAATATPSTVVATTALPAPGVAAAAVTAPAVVVAVAGAPVPTLRSHQTASPSVAGAVAALPAPVVSGTAVVQPSTVAAVASIQTPAFVSAGDATANPATVITTAGVGAAVVLAAARPTPSTVSAVTAVPAPTVGVGVTPPSVVAVAGVPAPTSIRGTGVVVPATVTAFGIPQAPGVVAGGSVTVGASTVSALAAVGVPSTKADGQVVPTTVIGVVSVPASTVRGTAQVGATTVAILVTVPAPIVFGGSIGVPVPGPTRKDILGGENDIGPLTWGNATSEPDKENQVLEPAGAPRAVLVGAGSNSLEDV